LYFGAGKFHEEFDNQNQETLTLRSDRVFSRNRTKSDCASICNNLEQQAEDRTGSVQSGLGDLLFQAIYAHTFNDRWAAGIGKVGN
jgi:hypothetical protein